jgi:hypothetical protein
LVQHAASPGRRHICSSIAAKSRREADATVAPPSIRSEHAMIKTALIAMTVIGCDCDARICEFIRETPAQWATVADCEAALKTEVLRENSHAYPLVSGVCRPVEPFGLQTATVSAGALNASPASAPVPVGLIEDGRAILYRTAGGYTLVRNGIAQAATGTAELAARAADWVMAKLP